MEHGVTRSKAAFFDRDGVMNELVDRGDTFRLPNGKPLRWTAPFVLNELVFKPRAREAVVLARQKGYLCVLVTNQPDVATGHIHPDEFDRMMVRVNDVLALDYMYVCMHKPNDGCDCRKPEPGMLRTARDAHSIDMTRSYMIGDMETDVQAGKAAGVRTILVTNDETLATEADHRVQDVYEAVLLLP